jgi:hypothetical protein
VVAGAALEALVSDEAAAPEPLHWSEICCALLTLKVLA